MSSYHPEMSEAENNDLLWETDSSSVEIRFQGRLEDGRPALDEVVAIGAALHLEQMDHDQWWMGIEAGGRYFHLNFSVDDGRLSVHLSDQTDTRAMKTPNGKVTIGRSRRREPVRQPASNNAARVSSPSG